MITPPLQPPALADIADAVDAAIAKVCPEIDIEDDQGWVDALHQIEGYGEHETFLDFTSLPETDQATIRRELILRAIAREYRSSRSTGQAFLDWLRPWLYAFLALGIYCAGCIVGEALTQFFFGNR